MLPKDGGDIKYSLKINFMNTVSEYCENIHFVMSISNLAPFITQHKRKMADEGSHKGF